jgi:hypothetical protein
MTRTLQHLKRQFAQLTTRAKKLLTAVGDGLVKDDGIFKEEYQNVLDERVNLQRLIDTEERLLRDQIKPITQMGAEQVAARLRERLAQAPKALQKRLVRALVDEVVVSPGEIVIHGPHDGLAETASGAKEPTFPRGAKVHAFGRNWLPGQDSNLRPTG